ncbi:MAG: dihydroorotate dehydrogenase electron transfer subunit [Bacteroidales bacterium]|nr:dihydroorotate dehydrogenase electron transfer subunit [Bacteroidales bacterium]
MRKFVADFTVTDNIALNANYFLLKLTSVEKLPEMLPGQFVEVKVDGSPTTFLRRPISINNIIEERNELWLLIQTIGDGTRTLSALKSGDLLNLILPLGNSFTLPENPSKSVLLIGGGVGTAPMLFWGKYLKNRGFEPNFLLGARSSKDLLQLEEFDKYGTVFTTTEDGSAGEKGFVTQHTILQTKSFDFIYTCGPKPMMLAVAVYAKSKNISCEVSLENTMACGFGVCLCCVENTINGNVCVCTEGPIFNINELKWQI